MKRKHARFQLSASDYSALRGFMRGYLHQDAAVEYGSAMAAARQFRSDADTQQLANVRSELRALLSRSNQVPWSDLARALEQDLGCSWRFRNRVELEELSHALG